ncbi:hypothetical protein Hanom_Chr03g00265671 [Helianthus anomalus]
MNMLPNTHEHSLTNETSVHVRSLITLTNVNELPAEQFTNYSRNVRFVYNPIRKSKITNQHP